MVIALAVLALLIILPGPILLSTFLTRRYSVPWMVLVLGILAFLVGQFILYPVLGFGLSSIISQDILNRISAVAYIFLNAFLQSLTLVAACFLGYWVAFRYLGSRARPVGSALTFSTGFSSVYILMIFFTPILNVILQIIIAQSSTPPQSMTADQFASLKLDVEQLLNAPFLKVLLHVPILPAISFFALQFASVMIIWVGVIKKNWLWLVSAFLWQGALFAAFAVVFDWINVDEPDQQLFIQNQLIGIAIMVALMAINLGALYLISRRVTPLLTDAINFVPPSRTAPKPSLQTSKPADKPVEPRVPAKKLKNTDLK